MERDEDKSEELTKVTEELKRTLREIIAKSPKSKRPITPEQKNELTRLYTKTNELKERMEELERDLNRTSEESFSVEDNDDETRSYKKLPVVRRLRGEIAELKKQRSNIATGEGSNYKARIQKRIGLSHMLGQDYKTLGELSENDVASNEYYLGGATNFAQAGEEAEKIQDEKQASRLYFNAARMYKKLGNVEKTAFYTRKARFARRMARSGGLEKIKGIHILALFSLSILFMIPHFTGNVTGNSFHSFDYVALVFFVLFLFVLSLKLYSRHN
jgi:hypothetical protein